MRPLILLPLALAACTTTQVQTALNDGRLFCAVGQSTVALQAVSGTSVAPILARGQSSAYVQAACALVNGIVVSPPADPGGAPVVTVAL